MKRQGRRDTKPEMDLRRELHRLGLRYRVDHVVIPDVRRRADVVFIRARIAIFVDGCFWHGCPLHGTQPKANAVWWEKKLKANVARDRDTDARLNAAAWKVIRLWAHDDMKAAAADIRRFILTGTTAPADERFPTS